ncbi:MAG TPA: ATP-binding cassette domain-containing protein [Firmicutes bacterium]|nr:ATP-binding cassette domain-containing protein [Bacillota bacterium]
MTQKEAVQVKNLTFGYGKKTVLEHLFLSVNMGESVAILGPNGAGKTTLFKLLLGLYQPWQGSIAILGREIKSSSDRVFARKKMAYVPQERIIGKLPITVFDSVLLGRYGKSYKGLKKPDSRDKETVIKALDTVGLQDLANKDVAELSGGELQRMSIARALVREADVVLLDEPIAHLDKKAKEEIPELIQSLQKEKELTMITITHEDINMDFDRVFTLTEGYLKEA